jgi:predicted component of type VI protein secretion system
MICEEALFPEVSCGKPKVTLIRNGCELELPVDGLKIGRGCSIAPDIFNHNQVSETHCEITIDNTDCYVEDIGSSGAGSTNGTFIDGVAIPKRTPTKLYDGNTLGIATLVFDVRLEHPQSLISEEPTEESSEKHIWAIVCPKCKAQYPVENQDTRIQECGKCVVAMHKKLISKETPKQVRAV